MKFYSIIDKMSQFMLFKFGADTFTLSHFFRVVYLKKIDA